MAQLLIPRRVTVLKRSIPYVVAIIILLGSLSFTAYYSLMSALYGNWIPALTYGIATFGLLWLYAPVFLENWLALYVNWHLPSCDYHRLDMYVSGMVRFLKILRCPNRGGQNYLGVIKMYEGLYGDAEYLMADGLLDASKTQWRDSPYYVILECNLVSAYSRQNRVDEAREVLEKAFARVKNLSNGFEIYSIFPVHHAMLLEIEQGELDEAKEKLKRVHELLLLAKLPRGFSRHWLTQIRTTVALGSAILFIRTGELASAEESYKTFFDLLEADQTSISPLTVKWMNLLAKEFMQNNLYERAEDMLNLSYGLLRRLPNHPDCQQTLGLFRQLLIDTNRKEDIEDMLAWVRPLNRELIGQDTQ